jgi:hypothetical protein
MMAPECFYCDCLVSKGNLEEDHFPVPRANGGELVVTACKSCHDMKDRFNLGDWPSGWVGAVINDWHKLSRETRIFLAKALRLVYTEVKLSKDGTKED